MTCRLQALTDRRGAPILPDDRPPRCGQRLPVPQDRSLALVGDTHGPNYGVGGRVKGDPGRRLRGLPDLLGGMLNPPRVGEVLGELGVATGQDLGLGGDQKHGDTGGAGIDGQDHPNSPALAEMAHPTASRKAWSTRLSIPSGVIRISKLASPAQSCKASKRSGWFLPTVARCWRTSSAKGLSSGRTVSGEPKQ